MLRQGSLQGKKSASSLLVEPSIKSVSIRKCSKVSPCNSCPFYQKATLINYPCFLQNGSQLFQQQKACFSSAPIERCTVSGSCKKCRYCGELLPCTRGSASFQCTSCRRIQPRESLNCSFFDLLQDGIFTYDIDKSALKKKYLNLQKVLHPDQVQGNGNEVSVSSDWSAFVNKGYETMKKDIPRAIYLYNQLSDIPYDFEGSGSLNDDELMEILELRELIEESKDQETSHEIFERTSKIISNLKNQLSEAFRQKELKKVRYLIDKLRFFDSILEVAESKAVFFSP